MGEGSFKICLIYSLQRCYIGITHLNLSGDFSPDKHWFKVIEDGVYRRTLSIPKRRILQQPP